MRRMIVLLVMGALAVGAMAAKVPGASQGGRPLTAELSGDEEVPPVDTDATGSVLITVNPGQRQVCWELEVADLTGPPIGAHIHRGPAGVNGPIVLFLTWPDEPSGTATGCATVDRELADELRKTPEEFYVNVHTTMHPGGEIRGQLAKG